MDFDYRLVSGGLKFIHGFNGVLTTLWYHQTCLPSDEFEKNRRVNYSIDANKK
jgi:hypothetical protein